MNDVIVSKFLLILQCKEGECIEAYNKFQEYRLNLLKEENLENIEQHLKKTFNLMSEKCELIHNLIKQFFEHFDNNLNEMFKYYKSLKNTRIKMKKKEFNKLQCSLRGQKQINCIMKSQVEKNKINDKFNRIFTSLNQIHVDYQILKNLIAGDFIELKNNYKHNFPKNEKTNKYFDAMILFERYHVPYFFYDI